MMTYGDTIPMRIPPTGNWARHADLRLIGETDVKVSK
jgi:hypothetical protein